MPKIIAISDTHNLHEKLEIPECDILIHAGDATSMGTPGEINFFLNWLSKQKAKYKVYVPGNHDWQAEENPREVRRMCEDRGISLLIDELVDLDGLKIYGSPITPYFCNWAFNRMPGAEIQKHWDLIKPCDILVTHGPPYGFLDWNMLNQPCGCQQLLGKILEIKPKAHVFGHLHDAYGIKEFNGIKFYNVANCNEGYRIERAPTEIFL